MGFLETTKRKFKIMEFTIEDFSDEAYKSGFNSWEKYFLSNWIDRDQNPYEPKTREWYLWNRGWNTNMKGIK